MLTLRDIRPPEDASHGNIAAPTQFVNPPESQALSGLVLAYSAARSGTSESAFLCWKSHSGERYNSRELARHTVSAK